MNTNQSKPMPLRSVVAELLSCYSRVNPKRSLQILNRVPAEIEVTREKDWLAPYMGDLYAILSRVGDNEIVFISAKQVNGKFKLYAVETEKKDLNNSGEQYRKLLPTLAILPAKFQFGFRA